MIEDFQYAYLIGCLFFLAIWTVLFLYRRDLRKEMLFMSLVVAPMGPLSEFFYLRDYWRPEFFNGWYIGIEDALFGFAIGGVAAVIYEEVFGARYAKRRLATHRKWMFIIPLIGIVVMFVGNVLFELNSIYVSVAILLLVGLSFLFYRHDLLKDALYSGFLIGGLMFVFYLFFNFFFDGIIQEWWMLENISGVLLYGAPLEELMWGFSWGFIAGPAYEFIYGLQLRKA